MASTKLSPGLVIHKHASKLNLELLSQCLHLKSSIRIAASKNPDQSQRPGRRATGDQPICNLKYPKRRCGESFAQSLSDKNYGI